MVLLVLLNAFDEYSSLALGEMYQGWGANNGLLTRVLTFQAKKNCKVSSKWGKLFQKGEKNPITIKENRQPEHAKDCAH